MTKRLLKAAAVFGIVVLLVLLGALLLLPRPSAPPPLPNPNGWDDLVKAGNMLIPLSNPPEQMEITALRALVATNAAGLRLARAGFEKECRVPIEYSSNWSTQHIAELADLKRLVQGFQAEGILAEREQRYADAAQAYLDAIRLGHECYRGGVLIDLLVGVACEAIGDRALQGICSHLDARVCHDAVRQLEDMDAKAESIGAVLENERTWSHRAIGWRGEIVALLTYRSRKQTEQKLTAKVEAQQRANRLLMVDLAARTYELEKGQRPKNLSDLVPDYLKAIPQDPLTGTNLVVAP